jgi:hypothetical protein
MRRSLATVRYFRAAPPGQHRGGERFSHCHAVVIVCQRQLKIPHFAPVENSPIPPVEISPGANAL